MALDNSVLLLPELDATTLQRDHYVYVFSPAANNLGEKDFRTKISNIEKILESSTTATVNASGAVPLDKDMILVSNISLSTINLTLADGTNGQEILFVSKTIMSNVIVTPTNFISNSFTFTLAGQSIRLKFIDTDWFVISNYGGTVN